MKVEVEEISTVKKTLRVEIPEEEVTRELTLKLELVK